MKTDEEMINSLFKRRDEYYQGLKKAELKSKGGRSTALKLMGGIAVPIAAAAAVALTLTAAQKNIAENDIDLTDSGPLLESTEKISSGAENISAAELLKLYESGERSKLCDDFKALKFSYLPMCISYNGEIYKSDYYMTVYNDSAPAVEAETSRYTAAGTAAVLENDFSDTECTVFDVTGEPDYKAVVANGRIELYRKMGDTVRTVQGIDFEIKALHRTAQSSSGCTATRLPVLSDGEDIVYRAYDYASGAPLLDTFILYTPELTGSYGDYAVWEVSGTVPEDILGEYPRFAPISFEQLAEIFDEANYGSLTYEYMKLLGAADAELSDKDAKTVCSQLYYIDDSGTEYAVEFYGDAESAVLTKISTNESISLIKDLLSLDDFLDKQATLFPEVNNYQSDSMTVSYEQLRSLIKRMNGGCLTKEDIMAEGGIVWDNDPKQFDFLFMGREKDYLVTAVIGNDERVRYFVFSSTSDDSTYTVDTVNAFDELFGQADSELKVCITYSDLLLLEERAKEDALTAEIVEAMGAKAVPDSSAEEGYAYELYYDLYSNYYFKIKIVFSDDESAEALITDTESGEWLDIASDGSNVRSFVREREETAYQRYLNTVQYISYSQLKDIAEKAKNNTLTVKYAESLGARHTNDGTENCLLFYNGEHFTYEIYISATAREGVKSVTLVNAILKYSGDTGLDLMTDADLLDWYLNRYLIDYDQLRAIAEKCGNGSISPEDFKALNSREEALAYFAQNAELLPGSPDTVYELYCGKYKAAAYVKDGAVIKVFLSYMYDTIDVGIDLLTDCKQFEIFLGNEPFPDVYTLEPITDKQFEELLDIIRKSDFEKRDERDYNKMQDYILHNTDHLISGDYYDEYRVIYERAGKKYVITYADVFYTNSRIEMSSDKGVIDLANDSDMLEDFFEGTYSGVSNNR